MKRPILAAVFAMVTAAAAVAQSPVVVPAATAVPAAAATRTTTAAPDAANAELLKELQAMKALNEETIRKQTAALQQLDEISKNAEQLRVFSKRN